VVSTPTTHRFDESTIRRANDPAETRPEQPLRERPATVADDPTGAAVNGKRTETSHHTLYATIRNGDPGVANTIKSMHEIGAEPSVIAALDPM
jgi:hypothetical protein